MLPFGCIYRIGDSVFNESAVTHCSKVQETRNKVDWQHALPWVILQHCLQFSIGALMCMLEEYSEDFDPIHVVIPKVCLLW